MILVKPAPAVLDRVAAQVQPLKDLRPAEMLAHLESWVYHPESPAKFEQFRQLLWQMAILQDERGDFWTNEQFGIVQRVLGKADFFYFADSILGFNKETYGANLQIGLHDEVCRLVEDEGKKEQAFLLPRYTLKTNLVTIAGRIWKTIKYPDRRLAIGSITRFQAVKMLEAVKHQFLTNQRLRDLYPDRMPAKGAVWNEDRIILPRSAHHREATIEIIAPEMATTGSHFDEICLDDIVTDLTVATVEQRQKTVEFVAKIRPLLSPGGIMTIVGTRWHDQDYFGMVIEAEERRRVKGLPPKTHIYLRRAIENGRSIFPTVLTPEFLEQQRQPPPEGMGAYLFSCNYMQDPIAEGGSFKPEWIDAAYYDPTDLLPMGDDPPTVHIVSKLTTVDLASSKAAYADRSVVMTCGATADGHLYVLEYHCGRVDAPQTIEWINDHWERFSPKKVGVESTGYQQTLIHWIEKGNSNRRLPIYVEPIKRTKATGTKEDRILRLVPFFAAGRIHFRRDHTELIDELQRFSPENRKHDDLLDCLADALELLQRPRRAVWQQGWDQYDPVSSVTGR